MISHYDHEFGYMRMEKIEREKRSGDDEIYPN